MNLRELARGRPCQVRLPGCDGGGETTVLAHYRLSGLNGVGMKPPDEIGAWACHWCHSCVDRRAGAENWDYEFVRHAHAEGVLRTIAQLALEGLL
jgi:hypothetical protein